MIKPVLLIVAGPNGAGKTTITRRLRTETKWSAGAEYKSTPMTSRSSGSVAGTPSTPWARQSIAFETVFSTDDKVDFLARARDAGYFTRVFFIGTNSPTINAARVAARVIQGGHTVPIGKIISRYERSIANLSAAIALADRTYIYDNSVDDVEAVLCARTADGLLRKVYCSLPAWVAGAVGNVEHHAAFDDVSLVASSEPP